MGNSAATLAIVTVTLLIGVPLALWVIVSITNRGLGGFLKRRRTKTDS